MLKIIRRNWKHVQVKSGIGRREFLFYRTIKLHDRDLPGDGHLFSILEVPSEVLALR